LKLRKYKKEGESTRQNPQAVPRVVKSSSNKDWEKKRKEFTPRDGDPHPQEKKKKKKREGERENSKRGGVDACWTCGNFHEGKICRLKNAKWANQDKTKSWSQSEGGRIWREKGFLTCPPSENPGDREDFKRKKYEGKGEYLFTTSAYPHTNCSVKVQGQESRRNAAILFDSAATNNFVSAALIKELVPKGIEEGEVMKKRNFFITTGIQDLSRKSVGSVQLEVEMLNEKGKRSKEKMGMESTISQTRSGDQGNSTWQ
jgi:hypothetical protein